ncbi:PTS galactitol transporter subunit IIA [Marinithermofilum abyssi]|uniref:PTS galactitol transporter subunit IIA n=1 Tax=Marinithermofilum abyssi TaxID=1571185 RepID=A0A8J2VCI8_9BACL|nr:PTS sugar transporter subunit IIA [Marinithermofilum abyssi]GGE08349.1 PTS galactitol transporter subunit IIA [Marinithermofilum abyssi]
MSTLYMDESLILQDIQVDTKEEVLQLMASTMQEQGVVKESYIQAVIDREHHYATGLPTQGLSVAIPHTDKEHVNRKSLSVGVLTEPVDFVIMGEDEQSTPVKLVFMLAMDESHAQLSLLQKLMGVFQDKELLAYLASERDKTKIIAALRDVLD